jgi:hypothetical protein
MRTLLRTRSVIIGSIILTAGVSFVFPQVNETALIEQHIRERAKAEEAEEYSEARKVMHGDVNHDGKPDLVVLYTLEGFSGSNGHLQYLAVFLAQGKTFKYSTRSAVGGKFGRDVSLKSIAGQTINVDTMEYRSNDPACCPSRKGKARFVYNQGKLKEIKG